MELLRKLRSFLSDPKMKLWWLRRRFGAVFLLLQRRRFGALVGYFVAAVTGWHPYDLYLQFLSRRRDGSIQREIRGNTMALNLEDRGLSRDLFLYGVREQRGTELFERELERSAADIDDGVVLEIGANIGYFALAELDALGESAELIAFEPDKRNIPLLERNLELNGHREAATIECAAVGPESGTAELELSSHTNLNKLRALTAESGDTDPGESVPVDVWSIADYLSEHDVSPESVVAVRMDIEGYEVEVLQNLDCVLGAPGPLVLSIEVHPGIRDPEAIRWLLDLLDSHGFDVVGSLTERITVEPFAGTYDVDDVSSLPDTGPAYNLIVKKDSRPQLDYEHDEPLRAE